MPKINSSDGEKIAKWYLRFNGYFIVDNFIVHAGDDPGRISNDIVGNYTETDILGIRYKYNKEITGPLQVQNDPKLLDAQNSLIDFVIVEVKTGNTNKPNGVWVDRRISVIKYIIRFAGIIETEKEIDEVATELAIKGTYHDKEKRYCLRLILISEKKVSRQWQHVTNILFDNIIDFFVDVRGKCWLEENIGIASVHTQWDILINKIFEIANDHLTDIEDRKIKIKSLLQRAD